MLNKGDICICTKRLMVKRLEKRIICKVRITSVHEKTINGYCYNVYNIDLNRYEKIGDRYLKLLIDETRDVKLRKLLDE